MVRPCPVVAGKVAAFAFTTMNVRGVVVGQRWKVLTATRSEGIFLLLSEVEKPVIGCGKQCHAVKVGIGGLKLCYKIWVVVLVDGKCHAGNDCTHDEGETEKSHDGVLPLKSESSRSWSFWVNRWLL